MAMRLTLHPGMPTPEDEAAAEPAPRAPVVQELRLTLDNLTDRALFQLDTLQGELRSAILHHGPCRPKGPFPISSENCNRSVFSGKKHYHSHSGAMALLLTNDEEAIS